MKNFVFQRFNPPVISSYLSPGYSLQNSILNNLQKVSSLNIRKINHFLLYSTSQDIIYAWYGSAQRWLMYRHCWKTCLLYPYVRSVSKVYRKQVTNSWFTFSLKRRRQQVPPKRQWTLIGLRGVIFQKRILLNVYVTRITHAGTEMRY